MWVGGIGPPDRLCLGVHPPNSVRRTGSTLQGAAILGRLILQRHESASPRRSLRNGRGRMQSIILTHACRRAWRNADAGGQMATSVRLLPLRRTRRFTMWRSHRVPRAGRMPQRSDAAQVGQFFRGSLRCRSACSSCSSNTASCGVRSAPRSQTCFQQSEQQARCARNAGNEVEARTGGDSRRASAWRDGSPAG
jgi:hypothetical protein